MSKRGPKKDLKRSIEDELRAMLEEKGEPNEQRMKLLKLGIGYLAVQAKLEETEYGGFFEGPDTDLDADGSTSKRKKPASGGDEGDGAAFDFGAGSGTH